MSKNGIAKISNSAVAEKSAERLLVSVRRDMADFSKVIDRIDSPESGKGAASQLDGIEQYYRSLNASRLALNEIQMGRFRLKSKIGALMPRAIGGRGIVNPSGAGQLSLRREFVADCRWISDHSEHLDAYFSSLEEDEASLSSLRRYINTAIEKQTAEDRQADRIAENRIFRDPKPEAFRNIKHCPAVVFGTGWAEMVSNPQAGNDYLENLKDWGFKEWFDYDGGLIVFRTLNRTSAVKWAFATIDALGEPLKEVDWLMGFWDTKSMGSPWEPIVCATVGNVKPSDWFPSEYRSLRDTHLREEPIHKMLLAFAKSRGTPNEIIMLGAKEKHAGYHCLTIEGELLQ